MSLGCTIPGTAIGYLDRAFFYHTTGFYMCISGSVPVPIGTDRVNQYFASRLAGGGEPYVFCAIDPQNSLYLVGFNYDGDTDYPIQEILEFKWDAGAVGEWAHIIDGNPYEILFNGLSSTNVTMEDLDIYVTMELVPYSLDSSIWVGIGQDLLGAFGTDHNSGWFNSGPMTATLTTTEATLTEGRDSQVRGYTALVDGASLSGITGTIYGRSTLAEMPSTNTSSQNKTPNSRGLIRARLKARFHRAEIVIDDPNWTDCSGIGDVEFHPAGQR